MLPEERAVIICSKPSSYRDPKLGLTDKAGQPDELSLMVALQKFETVNSGRDTSDEDILALAAERKDVGGKLFKAQRFELALARYSNIVDRVKSCKVVSQKGAELIRVCELNRAACLLKLGDHHAALAACTVVLKDDPGNTKALFRRASAQIELKAFSEAASDLQQLLAVDPENKEAQQKLAQAAQGKKKEGKRVASMCAQMTKAMDGSFAEDQARRAEEAYHVKKPGQVLSQAESDKAMEEAWAFAHASLDKMKQKEKEKEEKEERDREKEKEAAAETGST